MPVDYKHPQYFVHRNGKVTGPFQTIASAVRYAEWHAGGVVNRTPNCPEPLGCDN